jgi:hypothetical protein
MCLIVLVSGFKPESFWVGEELRQQLTIKFFLQCDP